MSRLVSPLSTTRLFGELKLRKRHQVEKLTTSHLARRLGLQSGILLNRLIGRGFIELKNGRKYLTPDGRRAGGEEITRRAKGRFIVWPQDLLLKILEQGSPWRVFLASKVSGRNSFSRVTWSSMR